MPAPHPLFEKIMKSYTQSQTRFYEPHLAHYLNALDPDCDLLTEAITSLESYFDCVPIKKVHSNSRPQALAYLALCQMERQLKTLKSNQPRVLEVRELFGDMDYFFLEFKSPLCSCKPVQLVSGKQGSFTFAAIGGDSLAVYEYEYNRSWRCWNLPPSLAHRTAAKWREV